MRRKAQTAQRNIKEMARGGTIVRGKILECITEDTEPYRPDLFNAVCACGSGGGCSGGGHPRATSM